MTNMEKIEELIEPVLNKCPIRNLDKEVFLHKKYGDYDYGDADLIVCSVSENGDKLSKWLNEEYKE